MYLVHWPVKLKPWACYAIPNEEDFTQLDLDATWASMEKCLDMGLCKGIGVSNFSSTKIQRLLDLASVPPAINQVFFFSFFKLISICHVYAHDIRIDKIITGGNASHVEAIQAS